MKPTGVYLVEAQIETARITNVPDGDILLTLRIGKNYASANHSRTSQTLPIIFNTTLQVNVDSSALETQRCSLTISLNTPNDKRMIGIALISLPKDKTQISNSYRLTQNEDKKAEVDIKIKIMSIDSSSVRSPTTLGPNSDATAKFEEPKPEADSIKEGAEKSTSNIKIKTKASQERSGSNSQIKKLPLKNFKSEGDKMIEISETQVRRYKEEKDVYYQMYQIQKSKNQVAYKFINTFIKKLAEKFPNLVPSQDMAQSTKKNGDPPRKNHQSDNAAAMAQLEQANRSLHRQIDQYKKVIDQLKQQLFASTKNGQENQNRINNLMPPSFIEMGIVPRQSNRQRSNIIPNSLKEPQACIMEGKAGTDLQKELRQTFANLDLKKWLEESIRQRQEIQPKFTPASTMQHDRTQSKTNFIKKLRSGIDKAFSHLLTSKDITKAALLTHKQQVNRLLDENAF